MTFLTLEHNQPPPRSVYGDGTIETQILIDRDDVVTLAQNDIYAHYTEEGDAPLGYDDWSRVPSTPADYYDRARSGTQAERDDATVAQTRDQLQREIDAQVPDGGARQLVEDALFEGQIQSYSGGASELKSDLEDTPDAELDAFNTTIHPTPLDGTGYIQAKMTTFVDIVDPWAGAPNDIYALRCGINIITEGEEASGASARAHMFNEQGVDQGVLPFVQDATNPAVWWCQSQEGRYWSDPAAKASMRLLWDSGSLPVAETKVLNGYGDRQYAIVRAGL